MRKRLEDYHVQSGYASEENGPPFSRISKSLFYIQLVALLAQMCMLILERLKLHVLERGI
jgi:hypothetical protein